MAETLFGKVHKFIAIFFGNCCWIGILQFRPPLHFNILKLQTLNPQQGWLSTQTHEYKEVGMLLRIPFLQMARGHRVGSAAKADSLSASGCV